MAILNIAQPITNNLIINQSLDNDDVRTSTVTINDNYFNRISIIDIERGIQGIPGPSGPSGPPGIGIVGPQGPAGRTILNGSGAPANNLGLTGDFYYNTENTDFYGPKLSDATWDGAVVIVLNRPIALESSWTILDIHKFFCGILAPLSVGLKYIDWLIRALKSLLGPLARLEVCPCPNLSHHDPTTVLLSDINLDFL